MRSEAVSVRRVCHLSFPDAKPRKNSPQNLIGGDFADDGAEVVKGFADVLGDEVGRDAAAEAVADALKGGAGAGQGFDMAKIGDDDLV